MLEDIGNYVGVSKATVQRWETGSISNMRRDRIKKLSEILQIAPEILLEAENKVPELSQPRTALAKIPVLGTVAAGANEVIQMVLSPISRAFSAISTGIVLRPELEKTKMTSPALAGEEVRRMDAKPAMRSN